MDADVRDRLLDVAERIVATELRPALVQAADVVADGVVSSSARYAPPVSAVRVTATLDARRPTALIAVADQGPGTEPGLAARIFARFARGPGSQGSGLGLYLACEIAIARGGALEVQTAPGRGSTSTFRLPAHTL